MTQVVLNIDNKKKWNALKTVLKAMNIEYSTQDTEQISEAELELFRRAENDKENGKVSIYTSHRDILNR